MVRSLVINYFPILSVRPLICAVKYLGATLKDCHGNCRGKMSMQPPMCVWPLSGESPGLVGPPIWRLPR